MDGDAIYDVGEDAIYDVGEDAIYDVGEDAMLRSGSCRRAAWWSYLSALLTFAPQRSNASAISRCPFSFAMYSGATPSFLT